MGTIYERSKPGLGGAAYLRSGSSAVGASNGNGVTLILLSSSVVSSLGWHVRQRWSLLNISIIIILFSFSNMNN